MPDSEHALSVDSWWQGRLSPQQQWPMLDIDHKNCGLVNRDLDRVRTGLGEGGKNSDSQLCSEEGQEQLEPHQDLSFFVGESEEGAVPFPGSLQGAPV